MTIENALSEMPQDTDKLYMRLHCINALHVLKCFLKNLIYIFSVITFIRYAQCQKIEKPENFKVFGNMKTKGPKQDSQNRVRSYMSEGGVPKFCLNLLRNYFTRMLKSTTFSNFLAYSKGREIMVFRLHCDIVHI